MGVVGAEGAGWDLYPNQSKGIPNQAKSDFELSCVIGVCLSYASSIYLESLFCNSPQSLDPFLIFSLPSHIPFLD